MLIISYHLVGCLTRNDRFGFMFLKTLKGQKHMKKSEQRKEEPLQ